MKKILPIIAIVFVVLLLIIGGFFLLGRRGTSESEPSTAPKEGVLIETPFEERPYAILVSRADGREFTLEISRISEETKIIEYELVYLTNGLSRGVVGSVDLKGESKISRNLLLGTCSRNVCKYDEGVEKGTLTLRFREPEGTRKFVSDFHLQQGGDELTSLDGKFKLAGKLSGSAFYITMSTIGLPADLEGEVASGPYGVFTSGSGAVKNGTVGLEVSGGKAELYAWAGKAWEKISGAKIEDQTISASISELATFVVVTPELSDN